jgi:hypothetical protein
MPKSKRLQSTNHLKLARTRRVRLLEYDDKRILQESKRTGQTAVSLIRSAVSLGLPELLATYQNR